MKASPLGFLGLRVSNDDPHFQRHFTALWHFSPSSLNSWATDTGTAFKVNQFMEQKTALILGVTLRIARADSGKQFWSGSLQG